MVRRALVSAAAIVWGAVMAAAIGGGRLAGAATNASSMLVFDNGAGQLGTFSVNGDIDLQNPFFQDLGTNGRRCVTCHQPSDAWTITPRSLQARFIASHGTDPIFTNNDGSNCEGDPAQTQAAKKTAYSLLMARGLIRVGLNVPANAEYPYSYQASLGVQRQIGSDIGVTADYSFNGQRKDRVTGYNINLSFNPATGLNYPFTDISHRPYPEWGQVPMDIFAGHNNYNGLETSFTKRMSHRWQASGTYTLSTYRDSQPAPWSGVMNPVAFAVKSPLAPPKCNGPSSQPGEPPAVARTSFEPGAAGRTAIAT